MRLKDTVTMFSTETFIDVFNPETTFKGKINPFAEVANSGAASQRRILETATTTTIPALRIVQAPSSEKFIVAALNYDYWFDEVIRHKYPVLPVDNLGELGSIGQLLATSPADAAVYSYPYFVRREIDEAERSDYLSGYELYFASVKQFVRGSVLTLGGQTFRLKTDTWIDGAGFSVAQAILLESPFQTFDIESQKEIYNSATDSYAKVDVPSVPCFIEPLKQDYEFVSPSFTPIEEGDVAISLLKAAATVGVNDLIGTYRVLSIRDFSTWITCQCRNDL